MASPFKHTHAHSHAHCCWPQGREAIAAKLSANIITGAGADRVLAMDLHSGQCVGYFDIPVDHVYGDSGGLVVVCVSGGEMQGAVCWGGHVLSLKEGWWLGKG